MESETEEEGMRQRNVITHNKDIFSSSDDSITPRMDGETANI